jgi:4-amino-4-deoxy-L-arabinose transferase-like glycosyltransferase
VDVFQAYRVALWTIVLLGIALRVQQYVYDRSLWMDEAFLALNIMDKSFTDLFGQLAFNQGAPPGFLLVERLDSELFGESEYSLRLFPLVSGIASIFLFMRVAQSILDRRAVLVALFLFSVADGLVYYSTELKQYSVDVAATLVVYIVGLALRSPQVSRRTLLLCGLVGLLVVWFSHVAIFAIVAVIIVVFIPHVARRRWERARALAPLVLIWTVSLATPLLYARSTLSDLVSTYNGVTTVGGTSAGEPVFPAGLLWFRNPAGALAHLLGIPASFPLHHFNYPVAVLGVIGAAALVRRDLGKVALVTLPFAIALAASSLHAYPILGRTILFTVPLVILFIGEGVVAAASVFRRRSALAILLVALVAAAAPALTAAKHVAFPYQREEVKPVLSHLRAEWRVGDSLYLYYRAQYAFRYYLECDCIELSMGRNSALWDVDLHPRPGVDQYAPALLSDPPQTVVGAPRTNLEEYVDQVLPLRGRSRVWLLATRVSPTELAVLNYLSCVGNRLEVFKRTTAALYLYDLADWKSADARKACGERFGL